jgi:hypothetical protein
LIAATFWGETAWFWMLARRKPQEAVRAGTLPWFQASAEHVSSFKMVAATVARTNADPQIQVLVPESRYDEDALLRQR